MTNLLLRECTCKRKLRIDEAPYIGAASNFLWFNCPHCRTTFVVLAESPNGKAFVEYMRNLTSGLKADQELRPIP